MRKQKLRKIATIVIIVASLGSMICGFAYLNGYDINGIQWIAIVFLGVGLTLLGASELTGSE